MTFLLLIYQSIPFIALAQSHSRAYNISHFRTVDTAQSIGSFHSGDAKQDSPGNSKENKQQGRRGQEQLHPHNRVLGKGMTRRTVQSTKSCMICTQRRQSTEPLCAEEGACRTLGERERNLEWGWGRRQRMNGRQREHSRNTRWTKMGKGRGKQANNRSHGKSSLTNLHHRYHLQNAWPVLCLPCSSSSLALGVSQHRAAKGEEKDIQCQCRLPSGRGMNFRVS